MKKILSFLLSGLILTSLILPVNAADTNNKSAGQVNVSSGNLNVRSTPSTSSAVKTTLRSNSLITLISKSGNWYHVEYSNGLYGYCHADYIKTVSSTSARVNLKWGNLNVRSGAGTSYSIIEKLQNKEEVVVLSSSNNWSKILFRGNKIGYVSSEYLSANSSIVYSSVKLNIPNFKQTDSRWANVKIGSSKKTISQIGCVTTAISMIETYRTGKTIYPDAMSKKLSYSTTGNVYWPTDYTAVTDNSNYLNNIYSLLKNGKPVLFGAKNSNGTQHWVVITGYSGGNILITSNFTINDPGSNSRTSLQQFLNSYPNFYKYFYY